jgi:hypothetical protein
MGNAKAKRDRAAENNRKYEANLKLLNGNTSEAPKSVENIGRVEVVKPKKKAGFTVRMWAAIAAVLGGSI